MIKINLIYPKYDIELIYHPKMYPDIESYVLALVFTFWFHEKKDNKASRDNLEEKKNQRFDKISSPQNIAIEEMWDHVRIEGTYKSRKEFDLRETRKILTHHLRYVIAKGETERYAENIDQHRGYDGMCRPGPQMW